MSEGRQTIDEVRALRIRVKQLVEQTEWRDMSSAPKETKAILVYCADRMNVYVVSWGKRNGFIGGMGWKHFGGDGDLSYEKATHWMPLPQLPKNDTIE